MTRTIAGLLDSHRTADLVVEHLVQEYGVPREQVRVYAGDAAGAAEARSPQDSDQGLSLSDLGLPEKARAYVEGLGRGGVLVAAQVEDDQVERGRRPRSWCRRPRGAFGVAQRAAGGPEAVIAGLR